MTAYGHRTMVLKTPFGDILESELSWNEHHTSPEKLIATARKKGFSGRMASASSSVFVPPELVAQSLIFFRY